MTSSAREWLDVHEERLYLGMLSSKVFCLSSLELGF